MSRPAPVTTQPRHRVRIADGELGVRLDVEPRANRGERPIICGAFRLARKDPAELQRARHRSIVLVIDFPSAVDARRRAVAPPHVFSPFASTVLLADDEVETSAHVDGWFSVDVWELFGEEFPRMPFRVFAVLGTHSSNLVDVAL